MTAMRVRVLACVFIGVLTTVAAAQPAPNPQGAKLFEEGRALAAQGKFELACEKFEASLAIDPAIGTQLNFADCHENLNHFAEAWRLFDSAADAEKITNPERAKFSRGRADALLNKLGVIVLKLATPDAPMLAVSIAGRTVKPAPVIKEIVDPGEVAITVTAQTGQPFQRSEKITAGKTVVIDVPAFDADISTGGTIVTPPSEGMSPRSKRLILAYSVGGVGAIALVTGVILGVKAKGDYNKQFDDGNCIDVTPGPQCLNDMGFNAQNDAISLANIGTGFGIAGAVLLGAGAALFFTAPRDVVVTPTATASSGGISVVGRF